jgi:hypothetical protein
MHRKRLMMDLIKCRPQSAKSDLIDRRWNQVKPVERR